MICGCFFSVALGQNIPKFAAKYLLGVSKNRSTPKSSIFIGFSIIKFIHFGGFPTIFGSTPYLSLDEMYWLF